MEFDANYVTKREYEDILQGAISGNADDQYKLARMYDMYNSPHVEFNVEKAFAYYKLAADQGHSKAQMYTGYCYESGEGVEKNIKLCIKYYKMAAAQGNSLAAAAVMKYL